MMINEFYTYFFHIRRNGWGSGGIWFGCLLSYWGEACLGLNTWTIPSSICTQPRIPLKPFPYSDAGVLWYLLHALGAVLVDTGNKSIPLVFSSFTSQTIWLAWNSSSRQRRILQGKKIQQLHMTWLKMLSARKDFRTFLINHHVCQCAAADVFIFTSFNLGFDHLESEAKEMQWEQMMSLLRKNFSWTFRQQLEITASMEGKFTSWRS